MTKYIYPQLNYREHIPCPNCQKLMVKRVSTEIDSIINDGVNKMPAKEWHWFCCCGNKETGGVLKGMPETDWVKKEWERVNNIQRESSEIDEGAFFNEKKANEFLSRTKFK